MAAAAVQYPTSQSGQMIQVSTAHLGTNEIRVGQRRSEAYVRLAEQAFLHHDEIVLCGLGNTVRTVVSCAEIIKFRKYGTIQKISTSMVELDDGIRQSVAKIQINMKRNEGIRELLEKIIHEKSQETV